MKYALVDSKATVHFQYLVALEEGQSLEVAKGLVTGNELDDLTQCWEAEEVTAVRFASDEDIEKAVEGSYMGSWGISQLKEVFAIKADQ